MGEIHGWRYNVKMMQLNTDCYWAYEDFTHYTLFIAGSLLYVLREAGFTNIEFDIVKNS